MKSDFNKFAIKILLLESKIWWHHAKFKIFKFCIFMVYKYKKWSIIDLYESRFWNLRLKNTSRCKHFSWGFVGYFLRVRNPPCCISSIDANGIQSCWMNLLWLIASVKEISSMVSSWMGDSLVLPTCCWGCFFLHKN